MTLREALVQIEALRVQHGDEIVIAQARGLMRVDADGLGWIRGMVPRETTTDDDR